MSPVVNAETDADVDADADADNRRARLTEQLRGKIEVEENDGNEDEWIRMEWEDKVRKEQLKLTQNVLTEMKRAFADHCAAAEEEINWIRYTTCDGLPDPNSFSDMNTYMYFWAMEDERCDINALSSRTDTVLYLLARLNEIINHSSGRSTNDLIEYKKMRDAFRKKLGEWMDIATYCLLRRIEENMTKEDMRNARYAKKANCWTCCVWALIPLPLSIARLNPKERKSVEINFDDIQVSIALPQDLDCHGMAIRGLWLDYDHNSDSCASFEIPELPARLSPHEDLLSRVQREYDMQRKIRTDQLEERKLRLAEMKAVLDKLENPPSGWIPGTAERGKGEKGEKRMKGRKPKKEKKKKVALKKVAAERETEALAQLRAIPYLPTPYELILLGEEEARKERQRLLFVSCEETEINLRKFRILAGKVHIDLLHQPPQPKDMRKNILLSTLQVPKELRRVGFLRAYATPQPGPDMAEKTSERTPEVIEAELKAHEDAMEALVFITIKLPDKILWSEPPIVAHWIDERRVWSTADVHDLKFNDEKQTIAFRSGRLGVHGLAAYKFSHLPYQGWELKPEINRHNEADPSPSVLLNITTATLQLEFIVREDLVCLNAVLPANSSGALRGIIGQYTTLHLLVERMREAGCDVFPERDAYSYVKALAEKDPVTEGHLRHCIGLLCTAYAFSWSRWNSSRPPREIVVQYKELRGCVAKQRTNTSLLVTPLRTLPIDCTEVSSEFSDAPLDASDPDGKQFYADLYNMALRNAGIKTRMLMRQVSFKLAYNVAKLLESTNVIGMSA